MKQDFSKKMAIIVRRDIESWKINNTISHIAAFLGNKMSESFDTGKSFNSSDGVKHPRNSQYPIIVLSVGNALKMSNLIKKIRDSGLLHIGFFREMIETTNDKEIEDIFADKAEEEIEYLGAGVFGLNEKVDKITKKLSL